MPLVKPGLDKLANPSLPALGEVLEFMRVMWAVDHALQRTSKRMAGSIGVTGPQRLVIRIVGRFPGIPAGHLARLLHVHPSTLTGVLRRLMSHGLIRRQIDPNDRRRLSLGLTRKGRLFDARTEGLIEDVIQQVLKRFSRENLANTRLVLESIAESLAES